MAFSRAETSGLIVQLYLRSICASISIFLIVSSEAEVFTCLRSTSTIVFFEFHSFRCKNVVDVGLLSFFFPFSFPFLSAFCFLILLLNHRASNLWLWMTVGVFLKPLLPLPLLVYLRIRISFNIVFSIRIVFRNAKIGALSLSDLVRICYSYVCDLMKANMVIITSSNHVYYQSTMSTNDICC